MCKTKVSQELLNHINDKEHLRFRQYLAKERPEWEFRVDQKIGKLRFHKVKRREKK